MKAAFKSAAIVALTGFALQGCKSKPCENPKSSDDLRKCAKCMSDYMIEKVNPNNLDEKTLSINAAKHCGVSADKMKEVEAQAEEKQTHKDAERAGESAADAPANANAIAQTAAAFVQRIGNAGSGKVDNVAAFVESKNYCLNAPKCEATPPTAEDLGGGSAIGENCLGTDNNCYTNILGSIKSSANVVFSTSGGYNGCTGLDGDQPGCQGFQKSNTGLVISEPDSSIKQK